MPRLRGAFDGLSQAWPRPRSGLSSLANPGSGSHFATKVGAGDFWHEMLVVAGGGAAAPDTLAVRARRGPGGAALVDGPRRGGGQPTSTSSATISRWIWFVPS